MQADRDTRTTAVGVDVGATLVKLASTGPDGSLALRLLPRDGIERVALEVESARPRRVGLTGGGAHDLARLLSMDTARVDEFDAWRRGAAELLREHREVGSRYLLVSVGTGTSVLCIDEGKVTRVGGTALGGGTVVGLGAGLAGTRDFTELADLARRGDRRRVDLLVREIGEVPLPGDVTAAAFAKLGRAGARPDDWEPCDLAHAVMGLVGENVALICNALAAVNDAPQIVYAGSTLRDNPALADILRGLTQVLGHQPVMLEDGEFAGALGALQAATEAA